MEMVGTIGVTQGVYFDLDNNGFSEKTGWVGKDDGLLVYDRNNKGVIDSGAELFGGEAVNASGVKSDNGFSALAEFDSNKDGVVDSKDDLFSSLKVWKDNNSDGVVQEGELLSLQSAGVQALNLSYQDPGRKDANGEGISGANSYVPHACQSRRDKMICRPP